MPISQQTENVTLSYRSNVLNSEPAVAKSLEKSPEVGEIIRTEGL